MMNLAIIGNTTADSKECYKDDELIGITFSLAVNENHNVYYFDVFSNLKNITIKKGTKIYCYGKFVPHSDIKYNNRINASQIVFLSKKEEN